MYIAEGGVHSHIRTLQRVGFILIYIAEGGVILIYIAEGVVILIYCRGRDCCEDN